MDKKHYFLQFAPDSLISTGCPQRKVITRMHTIEQFTYSNINSRITPMQDFLKQQAQATYVLCLR